MYEMEEFSTVGLEPKASVSQWRRNMAEVYFKVDVQLGRSDAIHGELRRRRVSDLVISSLRKSGEYRAIRTRELARTDEVERHVFVSATAGTIIARQSGREVRVSRGGMYLLNSTDYHEVDIAENGGMIVAALPSDITRSMFPGIDNLSAIEAFDDPFLMQAFADLCQGMLRQGSQAEAYRLRSIFLNVIDVAIATAGRSHGDARTARMMSVVLVAKIRKDMVNGLHRYDYGLADAAEACGVSRRALQAAFKEVGSTFSASLLEARLTKARLMLTSPRARLERIASIAAQCGFASAGHFATRYGARFGLTPSEERSRH